MVGWKLLVIARSEATKQSIYPRIERWIASRSLSSGAHSRDPLARKDGEKQGRGMNQPDQTTHVGFKDLPLGDKQPLVNEVFHSVASRYD